MDLINMINNNERERVSIFLKIYVGKILKKIFIV